MIRNLRTPALLRTWPVLGVLALVQAIDRYVTAVELIVFGCAGLLDEPAFMKCYTEKVTGHRHPAGDVPFPEPVSFLSLRHN
jgi:hypothetical protein